MVFNICFLGTSPGRLLMLIWQGCSLLHGCYDAATKLQSPNFLAVFHQKKTICLMFFSDQKDAGMSVDVHYLAALATRFHWRCFLH